MKTKVRLTVAVVAVLLLFALYRVYVQSQQAEIHGLIAQLSDSRRRDRAISELAKIGEPAIKPLLRTFASNLCSSHGMDPQRSGAAAALGKMGALAIEPLREALRNDTNPDVRRGAARALGSNKDPRSIGILISGFNDKDGPVIVDAARSLACKGPRALGPLLAALQGHDPNLRMGAALALNGMKSERVCLLLTRALGDPDKEVRRCAAQALGGQGSGAIEPLVAMLLNRREYSEARYDAAEALGQIGDDRVAEPLIRVLLDKTQDDHVRDGAAIALSYLRSPRAKRALKAALSSKDPVVRRSADALRLSR